jgi:hypothetical protein
MSAKIVYAYVFGSRLNRYTPMSFDKSTAEEFLSLLTETKRKDQSPRMILTLEKTASFIHFYRMEKTVTYG